MNSQEIKRLVGLDYGLEPGLNDCYIRMFYKAAEIHDVRIAETTFGQLRNLRIVMNDDNLGNLHSSTPRIWYLNLPTAEGRRRLVAYRIAHDIYYKAQGGIKNMAAKYILQDAEQAWHNWSGYPSFSHPAAQFFFANWIRLRPRQTQLPCNIRPSSTPLPSSIRPPSPPPPPATSLQSRYRSKRGHSSTLGAPAAPDIRQSGYPSFSHPAAQFLFANWIRPLPSQTQLPCNVRPRSTPLPSVIRPPSPPPPPAVSLQSRYQSKRGR
ncbi:hypothetical protein B0H14DRAFT_2603087 [Mycena olivaceomarginata]|nr:hypothetical protein B0H14DRAFT_2603087 [Mycena olivaceomarginata]